jgi:hypothetical protein
MDVKLLISSLKRSRACYQYKSEFTGRAPRSPTTWCALDTTAPPLLSRVVDRSTKMILPKLETLPLRRVSAHPHRIRRKQPCRPHSNASNSASSEGQDYRSAPSYWVSRSTKAQLQHTFCHPKAILASHQFPVADSSFGTIRHGRGERGATEGERDASSAVVVMGVKWRMKWARRPRCRKKGRFQAARRILCGDRAVAAGCTSRDIELPFWRKQVFRHGTYRHAVNDVC